MMPCHNTIAERERKDAKEITPKEIERLVDALISEWETPGLESRICRKFSDQIEEQIGEQSEKIFAAMTVSSDAIEAGLKLQNLCKSIAEKFVDQNLDEAIRHFDFEETA